MIGLVSQCSGSVDFGDYVNCFTGLPARIVAAMDAFALCRHHFNGTIGSSPITCAPATPIALYIVFSLYSPGLLCLSHSNHVSQEFDDVGV